MPIVAAAEAVHQASSQPRHPWAWPLAWFVAALCAIAGAQLLALTPDPAHSAAAGRVGATVSLVLSRVTGVVPVATGELLLLAYAGWLTYLTTRAVRALRGRQRSRRSIVAGASRRMLRDGSIALVVFYALWGLNYARPQLELDGAALSAADVPLAEWVALAQHATTAANDAYVALHGTTDAGRPTALADSRDAERAIDEGWRRAAEALSLPRPAHASWGPVKWPLLSPLIARAGILGIYFPFTAEANVVRGAPAVFATQTMAHEKAHQRGVAREGEASFVGFLAGALSSDPLSRYGAAAYAQGRLLGSLARRSPDEYRRVRALRHPGVQRDLDDAAAYFRRHAGLASAIGSVVNDRYLRANRVAGGIENYGASTLLLVSWARRNGGALMPPQRSGTN